MAPSRPITGQVPVRALPPPALIMPAILGRPSTTVRTVLVPFASGRPTWAQSRPIGFPIRCGICTQGGRACRSSGFIPAPSQQRPGSSPVASPTCRFVKERACRPSASTTDQVPCATRARLVRVRGRGIQPIRSSSTKTATDDLEVSVNPRTRRASLYTIGANRGSWRAPTPVHIYGGRTTVHLPPAHRWPGHSWPSDIDVFLPSGNSSLYGRLPGGWPSLARILAWGPTARVRPGGQLAGTSCHSNAGLSTR